MPRRYQSSVRADRTAGNRAALVAAATTLFLQQGWNATTVTQVAAAAGLARPTLYLHFDTKLALLIACIDSALSDTPVAERADYQAMAQGTTARRAVTAARWLREAYQRSAPIQRILDQAASSGPEAAQAHARMEQRRHNEFARACSLVLADPSPPTPFVDEIWALGSRMIWFKLAERGWSPQEWEAWFTRVIIDAIKALQRRA